MSDGMKFGVSPELPTSQDMEGFNDLDFTELEYSDVDWSESIFNQPDSPRRVTLADGQFQMKIERREGIRKITTNGKLESRRSARVFLKSLVQ